MEIYDNRRNSDYYPKLSYITNQISIAVMGTIEIKNELHKIIENSDATSVSDFYMLVTDYMTQAEKCIITIAEENISDAKINCHQYLKEIMSGWEGWSNLFF